MFNFDTHPRTEQRQAIDALYRRAETACVEALIDGARLDAASLAQVRSDAAALIAAVRDKRTRSGGVDALMQEFSLSSDEGVALMCLAEALLRIPDAATRDALIRDKIGGGDWDAHIGRSPSLFVNAAAWGLLVTGKLVATHSASGLSAALGKMLSRGGEPVIRKGVDLAMRMLGRQFVTGETIEDAIKNGAPNVARGYRYSYDMLGEAALTAHDAQGYLEAYEHAIDVIGQTAVAKSIGVPGNTRRDAGISVKLSALHPRYARAQRARVMTELLPRLKSLAMRAKRFDIGLNIDAEEADRLDVSLDLLECLAEDRELDGWSGLGFVIQAYQKRAPAVIDFVVALGRRTHARAQRQIMVRLVKGAYWDTEIKRAQVDGQIGYPVYTRKVYTDVAYQGCATKLLSATDVIYPQFATHNAYTLSWVRGRARNLGVAESDFEFQCLHGMGETLYDQVIGPADAADSLACRIYAPVGSHETLLAYLVRRLLENGANSSFVNRIVDEAVTIDELTADPVAVASALGGQPHPAIPLPADLFATSRINSPGTDFSSEGVLEQIEAALAPFATHQFLAGLPSAETAVAAVSPSDHADVVGHVMPTPIAQIDAFIERATAVAKSWATVRSAERARILRGCAEQLSGAQPELIALAVREAGKTLPNAIGEIREAIDFCRYYAWQIDGAEDQPDPPLAPLVCISPWNFPLAIFTGQVVAALAAGRCVIAKPAEQSTLMAARAVALFHAAGVPPDVLQVVLGTGETVGAALVAHPGIGGVLFTGSTSVARSIQRTLAPREDDPILIAETGGQNAMIVDSSALAEQVVQDVVVSAFDSAGQRCSALRVLCLQDECADDMLEMLKGAMRELLVGAPALLSTDIGPVIDVESKDRLLAYIEQMRNRGFPIFQTQSSVDASAGTASTFVPPTLIEIRDVADLREEVFGPVLHVIRYPFGTIDQLVDALNATGYGLTMGAHSRIDENIERVAARSNAGNIYINRNMVGAVVGVQPFGGEGLSGTGPKAGGPLYLARLGGPLGRELADALVTVTVGDTPFGEALANHPKWSDAERQWIRRYAATIIGISPAHSSVWLAGPTGETNRLVLEGRRAIACVATRPLDLACQLIAANVAGALAYVPDEFMHAAFAGHCEVLTVDSPVDALCFAPDDAAAREWRLQLVGRDGPIINAVPWNQYTNSRAALCRLLHEKSVSINTAAAGGNASLMSLAA